MAHLTSALTSVKGVNKTDVTTLVSNFGVSLLFLRSPLDNSTQLIQSLVQSFEKIVNAPSASLSNLPGLGDKKVKRLRDAFTGNFTVKRKRKGNAEKRAEEGRQELN